VKEGAAVRPAPRKPASAASKAPPIVGPVAIAVSEGKLALIDVHGGGKQVLTDFEPAWCAYDDGNRLVWALGRINERLRLFAVSLEGDTHELASFPPEAQTPSPEAIEPHRSSGQEDLWYR
jgi:hypothetical protein